MGIEASSFILRSTHVRHNFEFYIWSRTCLPRLREFILSSAYGRLSFEFFVRLCLHASKPEASSIILKSIHMHFNFKFYTYSSTCMPKPLIFALLHIWTLKTRDLYSTLHILIIASSLILDLGLASQDLEFYSRLYLRTSKPRALHSSSPTDVKASKFYARLHIYVLKP